MIRREYLFFFFFFKFKIFVPSKLSGMGENGFKFNEIFVKIFKKRL